MFIKYTKSGGHTYVQITKSYRENGKVKHKTLANLGRLDKLLENESAQKVFLELSQLFSKEVIPDLSSGDVEGQQVLNWGYCVYKRQWERYGLHRMMDEIGSLLGLKYSLNDVVFYEVLNHLLNPSSKLSGFRNRENVYANLKTHDDINAFYRCLDVLAEHKDEIEKAVFDKNRSLFNMNVDVVFYDVTTFHFESVRADELRNFGFSKAGKFNEVQVVMGMLVDLEGRPIGYELFPGNTFDSKTLVSALDMLNQKFGVRRAVIVADRGINSKMNLKAIKDSGYGYVVASKIKGMSKVLQEKIKEDVWDYVNASSNEEGVFKYKVLNHTNKVYDVQNRCYHELDENLIITYSLKRARKDEKDRNRQLEKAKALLESSGKINASNRRGPKKFLKETRSDTSEWSLDDKRIEAEASFDGLYGIQTSEKALSPMQIIEMKNTLWKIEESFRILKTTLETRPVFHWTPKRIRGHFVLCFLAFLLERSLEIKAKDNEITASPQMLKDSLNSLQVVGFSLGDKQYYLKTGGDSLGNKLVRLFRIKPPSNITEQSKLFL
jgi:transposase